MKTGETLEVASREEFRDWLAHHHKVRSEIWLIYYYKHTGKQKLSYGESVEEAICFGWIDSQQNRMDEERFVRRFSQRRSGSNWSKYNRQRALKMLREGAMTEAGYKLLPVEIITEWEESKARKRMSSGHR
jgi:uncharacterized protein YdeI (YjbR/CyaY-like superfamily)